MRIIVIDDEESMREQLEKMLRVFGHEVVLAADGDEGIKQHRLAPADVIITDLYMPNRDGIETITEFRRHFPDVRIVAMSGNSIADAMLMVARKLGANAVLFKPFAAPDLQAAIAKSPPEGTVR